jgi:DNA-binding NarL/FixJ family response regulator
MPRLLIGHFGSVARLGLGELLGTQALEVVAEAQTPARILASVSDVRPDVVLLNLDDEHASAVAHHITTQFPAIKVIACSCQEPVMFVFPPFHHGESYASELNASLLAMALSN